MDGLIEVQHSEAENRQHILRRIIAVIENTEHENNQVCYYLRRIYQFISLNKIKNIASELDAREKIALNALAMQKPLVQMRARNISFRLQRLREN
jgi:hypothetical protein